MNIFPPSFTFVRLAVLAVFLSTTGCENSTFNSTQMGVGAGTLAGAGLGAIIGSQTGNAGPGVAIGAGLGALTGGLLGHEKQQTDDRMAETDRRLDANEKELEENRNLLKALRNRGLDVTETKRGVSVSLPDVLFNLDSAQLTGEAKRNVGEIAKIIQTNAPDRLLAVEGHTDSTGSVDYNQRLSEDRARSVADSLNVHGVAKRRIAVRGYGEGRPVATNKTDAGRSKNRRVEVIIEKSR